MKKTSLAKRNALLSSRNMSWGALALALVLALLFLRLLAPDFFWRIFTPVFRIADTLSAESHGFFNSFSDARALAELTAELKDENALLANENKALTQKIENVSALLGAVAPSRGATSVLAGVVARPPESPYDVLILAAGEKDGVKLGMEAFGTGGTPIGIVTSVSDSFSQITLFSAANMTTSAWVGHAATPLTIMGTGAGTLKASVARTASIAVGDTVFVPGPGMLPIGSVVRIDSDPLSPGVTLRIMPALNLFSLAWVELRATGVVPASLATSTLP